MRSRLTILVVDDEPVVLRTMRGILLSRGHDVIATSSGDEALKAFDEATRRVDLVITDVMMPRMSGTDLAARLRERAPRLPILFTAGMPDTPLIRTAILERGEAMLPKPFTPAVLFDAIADLLRTPAAMAAC